MQKKRLYGVLLLVMIGVMSCAASIVETGFLRNDKGEPLNALEPVIMQYKVFTSKTAVDGEQAYWDSGPLNLSLIHISEPTRPY